MSLGRSNYKPLEVNTFQRTFKNAVISKLHLAPGELTKDIFAFLDKQIYPRKDDNNVLFHKHTTPKLQPAEIIMFLHK